MPTEGTGLTSEELEGLGEAAGHVVYGEPIEASVAGGHVTMPELEHASAPIDLPGLAGDSYMPVGSGLGEVQFAQWHGAASSEEESEVHTEVLREKAERGQAAIKELYEIIHNAKELVAASESYWTGATAEYFREELAKGLKCFEADLDAIADYPRELIAYADRHEGVITQANALAAGVEDIVWSED